MIDCYAFMQSHSHNYKWLTNLFKDDRGWKGSGTIGDCTKTQKKIDEALRINAARIYAAKSPSKIREQREWSRIQSLQYLENKEKEAAEAERKRIIAENKRWITTALHKDKTLEEIFYTDQRELLKKDKAGLYTTTVRESLDESEKRWFDKFPDPNL